MELWEEHPEILEKVEVIWVDSGYDGDKASSSRVADDSSPC
jgi:putative transposase